MSKIPVEKKKGGMPWWAWLLIAVAVIALLFLLWPLLTGGAEAALLAPALAALVVPHALTGDDETSAIAQKETTDDA